MRSCFLRDAAVVTLATSSLSALGFVQRASAQSVTALNGSYSGTYQCAQSVTNLTLTITVTPVGELSARVTVAPPSLTGGQSYSYRLTGHTIPALRNFNSRQSRGRRLIPPTPAWSA